MKHIITLATLLTYLQARSLVSFNICEAQACPTQEYTHLDAGPSTWSPPRDTVDCLNDNSLSAHLLLPGSFKKVPLFGIITDQFNLKWGCPPQCII